MNEKTYHGFGQRLSGRNQPTEILELDHVQILEDALGGDTKRGNTKNHMCEGWHE